MPGSEEAAAAATAEKRDRIFLVVVDDSAERAVAMRYACLRARKGGGRVALGKLGVMAAHGPCGAARCGILLGYNE